MRRLASRAIQRTRTHIVLTEQIPYRTAPALGLAARGEPESGDA